ncbi:MAG: isochorismate synthase DhbC, partial [Chloroflexales bacterium]|nr:isochorismate synthase DhbC [Chloroflexales bacterium]
KDSHRLFVCLPNAVLGRTTLISQHDAMPALAPHQLLDDYVAGSSFFFATPQHTLLTRGVYAMAPCGGEPDAHTSLSDLVAKTLAASVDAGQTQALVVGAAPFDNTAPQLIVPMTVQRAGSLHCDTIPRERSAVLPPYAIRFAPTPEAYMRGVEDALTQLRSGRLSKIVLSRTLELSAATPIAITQLLRNLVRHNPLGYTFAVDLPQRNASPGAPRLRTLIGASPELLVARAGMRVVSNPLAGSAARSADPIEDRRRAAALLTSAKDHYEHAVVVDMVASALGPYCRCLQVPAEPTLSRTETMWHLSSRISGELLDPAISVLTLANALHPTPAVCGFPTELARATIKAIEPFDRGFFTGMVGWCDANGDGEWAVTIRCAEVEERLLRLFAGAGIVTGSQAEAELAETQAKFRTMLNALGLNQAWEADTE